MTLHQALGRGAAKKTRRKVPEPGGWSKNCAPGTYNAWGGTTAKGLQGTITSVSDEILAPTWPSL